MAKRIKTELQEIKDPIGPLLCTKPRVCLNLKRKKDKKKTLFSCRNEISVLKLFIEREILKQTSPIVTETSQVLFFAFHLLSVTKLLL